MAKIPLAKPVLGIDQLSDETSLLTDAEGKVTAVREAVNVDIDNEGNVSRRKGYVLKLSGSDYHSLYESERTWLMICKGEQLGVYTAGNNTFTPLVTMPNSYQTSFAELNGNMYFANSGYIGMIRANEAVVRTLGVPLPDMVPVFAATASGSLPAGKYGISYTLVNDLGEESPLGEITTVTLSAQGSIQGTLFTVVAGYKYRIYMTTADGEELYQAAEFDADSVSYLISAHDEGRRPVTQNLSLLPFGYILRAHGSRLYVATRDFVYYSDPFMPHLTNEGVNFLPATGLVTMVQPVDGGIYIADQAGVRFYVGDDPTTFEVKDVSTDPVVYGTAISVPGDFLPEKLASADSAAIWLTPSGYQVGLATGEVVRLHARQLQLPRYNQGCATFSILNGRKQVVTPVNSNALADVSVALDSTIG